MGRYYDDELYHHGIKGQRWGIRRFQNKDGSYTSAGKSHRKGSSKDSNQNAQRKGLSDKQKRALKIGAAAIGVALIAGGTAYAVKSKQANADVARVIDNAFKPDTFKPNTFKPNTVTPNVATPRIVQPSSRTTITPNVAAPKTAQPAKRTTDFEFAKNIQIDSKGRASSVNVPKDKKGYAHSFASEMAKGSKNYEKDYIYWHDYMTRKLKHM